MIHKLLLVLFLIFGGIAKTQTTIPAFVKSTLVLISEDKTGKATKYSIENAYMILGMSTGEFMLYADLSNLITGNRVLDSLLRSNGEQQLSFKGNISENLMVFNQQQNDERSYDMPGVLNINGNSANVVAQFDPINLAEKSESKNYRIDFTLSVDASKINIAGLESVFFKQVVFEVVGGMLNIQQ